jgi:hypothetical protein
MSPYVSVSFSFLLGAKKQNKKKGKRESTKENNKKEGKEIRGGQEDPA